MALVLLVNHIPCSFTVAGFPEKLGTTKLRAYSSFGLSSRRVRRRPTRAFFNPLDDPILKEGLKEPVAFLGGVFAGLLRLDLNDDPLKEWVTKTVEAAGLTEDEAILKENESVDDAPQEIEIE